MYPYLIQLMKPTNYGFVTWSTYVDNFLDWEKVKLRTMLLRMYLFSLFVKKKGHIFNTRMDHIWIENWPKKLKADDYCGRLSSDLLSTTVPSFLLFYNGILSTGILSKEKLN